MRYFFPHLLLERGFFFDLVAFFFPFLVFFFPPWELLGSISSLSVADFLVPLFFADFSSVLVSSEDSSSVVVWLAVVSSVGSCSVPEVLQEQRGEQWWWPTRRGALERSRRLVRRAHHVHSVSPMQARLTTMVAARTATMIHWLKMIFSRNQKPSVPPEEVQQLGGQVQATSDLLSSFVLIPTAPDACSI